MESAMNSHAENKTESFEIREQHLPLPGKEQGYRSILMLGTFGAGKTTTIRQLLGTHPVKEKFPATNPGKTTIADSEYILTPGGEYSSVITFFDLETIEGHLLENLISAGHGVVKQESDFKLFMRLLDHQGERFRFSYLFGAPRSDKKDDFDDDSEELPRLDPRYRDAIEAFQPVINGVKELATKTATTAETHGRSMSWPDAIVQNYIDEQIDEEFSRSSLKEEFLDVAVDLIINRIEAIEYGEYFYDDTGWPLAWRFTSPDRAEFLGKISPFTSNSRKRFGELLFPLVNGVRVSGPFIPNWADTDYKFVIADTQGLEHSQVGNAQSSDMEKFDFIALVDNSVQPLLAAPWGVVSYLATTGGSKKLRFLFTHFDNVRGDGMETQRERRDYVLAHLENKIQEQSEAIGPVATRELNRKAATDAYYLGALHEVLDTDNPEHALTIRQLKKFLSDISTEEDEEDSDELPIPVYSRKILIEAVKSASSGFRKRWLGYLGIDYNPDYPKAHWATMKALTRRLAEGWADEHSHLAPVAQFRTEIETNIFRALSKPDQWTTNGADQDEKDQVVQRIAAELRPKFRDLADHRIAATKRSTWYDAFSQAGTGSSKLRAAIIETGVINQGSPEIYSGQSVDLVVDVLKLFEDLGRSGLLFLID
jgi:hypothetical protein